MKIPRRYYIISQCDEFELPLNLCKTQRECAEWLGITQRYVEYMLANKLHAHTKDFGWVQIEVVTI